MLKRLVFAAAGTVALGAAALPQVAFAQQMDHNGPGHMGGRGPDEFRVHGGHFGGGQGFRSGGHGQFGNGAGMDHRGPDNFRFGAGHARFGGGEGFRFRQDHRNFGYGEGFRFHHAPERFAYGDRFHGRRQFDDRRGFGRGEFRHGYRFGVIRPYPVYVGHRYRERGFAVPYAGPYLVNAGYGLPSGGCSTRRFVSWTPVGWRKIVTVRTCYVR